MVTVNYRQGVWKEGGKDLESSHFKLFHLQGIAISIDSFEFLVASVDL